MGRRIRIFLISVVFGILLSYLLIFQGKDSNYLGWTVNNRVLEDIKAKPLAVNSKTACLLDCHKIRQWDINKLLDDGEVILSESSPREDPRKYVLEYDDTDREPFKLFFALEKDSSRVIALLFPTDHNACNCP